MSPASPDALYHSIPQVVNDADLNEIDPAIGENEGTDVLNASVDPPSVFVDARIRWIHFILGCSVLLPWNVVITATPFFLSRLEGSSLKHTFSSYLSTTFMVANFIFLAHATAVSKRTSPSQQIRFTLIALSFLTFLLTLSTYFHIPQGPFFAFVLLNAALQGIAGAYLQTSAVAVASLFGPSAVQAMITGQAAVAVAVSFVQVVSAAASLWGTPEDSVMLAMAVASAEEQSAFIFFSLSTIFLIAVIAAHRWLINMPIYRTIAAPLEHKIIFEAGSADERRALTSSGRGDFVDEKARIMRVAKANVTYEIAVAYVFMVTLAVFPPITTSVQPTNPKFHPLLFSSVHFLVFNVGDYFGRFICSFPRFLIWSARRLLGLSALRTLFIPLFLMCNVQRPTSSIQSTAIINSDFWFMFILLGLGFTNGYLSSLCMMAAPSLEHNPRLRGRKEDVDVAATVASFCLVGGLTLGSVGSFAVKAAICNCNPFIQ